MLLWLFWLRRKRSKTEDVTPDARATDKPEAPELTAGGRRADHAPYPISFLAEEPVEFTLGPPLTPWTSYIDTLRRGGIIT